MITELNTALAIIVFAGGPHTATRFEHFLTIHPQHPADVVYLTGADFHGGYAARVSASTVETDDCGTTLTSCFSLARRLRARHPEGCRVLVITSNYHAPRVAWLLRGVLPRRYPLTLHTTRDMTRESIRTTALSRRLLRGEIISWLYCAPAGLLLRPLPLAAIALLAVLLAKRRKRPHRPDTISCPP